MNIVGLITEYNPFHNGHLYHIQEAKKRTNADYVIVIMSGNFVQRGTPALMDKYTRTSMALAAGADLVLELPVHFATASAEYFSMGAVSILHQLGVVTHLCFGSECGDISVLSDIAKLLMNETEEYKEQLSFFLKQGYTYPKARMQAIELQYPHIPRQVLESPNNILGIEYMKALLKLNSSIIPVTITRQSAMYHDAFLGTSMLSDSCATSTSAPDNDFDFNHTIISSATAIRKALLTSKQLHEIEYHVPDFVYSIMLEAFEITYPMEEDDFSLLLNYRLMNETPSTLSSYMDVTEELGNRIKNLNTYSIQYHDLVKELKSKQLTHTRISRGLNHILLNIKKDSFLEYTANGYGVYARILGFKKESSSIIRSITNKGSIPVITKVADAKNLLPPHIYKMFEEDIYCTHLYNEVVYNKFRTKIKDEYTHGVIRY